MASEIKYEIIKTNFDDLHSRGIVQFSAPEIVRLEDNGFKLEYYITKAITKKHETEQSFQPLSSPSSDHPLCFGPGSDIADIDPKLHIATLCNGTHILVLSKFCVYAPQLLLLTSDSYRRQRQPLDVDDLEATWRVITALDAPHFAFYNCGVNAGSSREHKHVQVLLRPGPLFPDDRDFDRSRIPYVFFLRYLDGDDVEITNDAPGMKLRAIYQDLLAQARAGLDLGKDEECPHNVVLVKEWIMVIPRRSNDFHGVTANAAGMMGYVWLGDHGQLDRWKEVGLARALAGLGVPSPDYQPIDGEGNGIGRSCKK